MDGLQVNFNPNPQPQHLGGGHMHEEVFICNGDCNTFGQ